MPLSVLDYFQAERNFIAAVGFRPTLEQLIAFRAGYNAAAATVFVHSCQQQAQNDGMAAFLADATEGLLCRIAGIGAGIN